MGASYLPARETAGGVLLTVVALWVHAELVPVDTAWWLLMAGLAGAAPVWGINSQSHFFRKSDPADDQEQTLCRLPPILSSAMSKDIMAVVLEFRRIGATSSLLRRIQANDKVSASAEPPCLPILMPNYG
jgi:hypothetical protein